MRDSLHEKGDIRDTSHKDDVTVDECGYEGCDVPGPPYGTTALTVLGVLVAIVTCAFVGFAVVAMLKAAGVL